MADRDALPSSSLALPIETLWSKLAAAHDNEQVYAASAKELRSALSSGPIPDNLRATLWLQQSGAFRSSRRGVYASLLHGSEAKPGEHAQIALDIGRSGIHDPEQQMQLSRVLTAFSSHSRNHGYVQGQNFIAAGLLRILPEEEAFWLLTKVVDDYLPRHFAAGMSGSFIDCRVLAELLANRCPDVSAKLCEMEISVQLLATRWFLTLWSSVLPPPTLLRVYDALFLLGPSTTLLVALTCFVVMRPTILSSTQPEDFADGAISRPLREVSPDEFMRVLLFEVGELKQAQLEKMRQRLRDQEQRAGSEAPNAVATPAAAKRPSLKASLQYEINATFKRMFGGPSGGMAGGKKVRRVKGAEGGGAAATTQTLLNVDGTAKVEEDSELKKTVQTAGSSGSQLEDDTQDPRRIVSPDPVTRHAEVKAEAKAEAKANAEANAEAKAESAHSDKGSSVSSTATSVFSTFTSSSSSAKLSLPKPPPAVVSPADSAPKRLPLGQLAANTIGKVARATSFSRGAKKKTVTTTKKLAAWPTYTPTRQSSSLPRLPTEAEEEAEAHAELAAALAASAIAAAIAMFEAGEADAATAEAVAQAVEEEAAEAAEAVKAVALAAEADELESLLADVEEAAAATPATSPLCTPATSTATRRTDPLLLLLPLLATAVGVVVGGVALVGTSSSSRSPPASPPSAVSMLPDPASPPPVPPFSSAIAQAPPCSIGQWPADSAQAPQPPKVSYHRGQYYFSCTVRDSRDGGGKGRSRRFRLRWRHLLAPFLYPAVAVNSLVSSALGSAVSMMSSGAKRLAKALVARLMHSA